MPRLNTRLEAEGAEFLVLGNLLIEGIPAYKYYTNMPEYDLIATNPERKTIAHIQIKSRWATSASQFLIRKFKSDFVVIVKLNRGSKSGKAGKLPPEFYVIPTKVVKKAPRAKQWGRIAFGDIPNFGSYLGRWDLIREFLKIKPRKAQRVHR
ncbi:MAG: hypothetical protein ABSE05_11370 [Syntrophales bacterium]|jgi:hypothetical protein